jgi:glycerophosphoryl diester phosphodiesterase
MLIYAHRGAHQRYREQSLDAYQEAIAQKADGFECDIRLTRDGQAICWHDPDTFRMTGERKKISSLTLKELAFSQPLLLTELIDLAVANKKNLAIESKHPVRSGREVERKIIEILHMRKSEIEKSIDIALMSFSPRAISRFRHSSFPTVQLFRSERWGRWSHSEIAGPALIAVKNDPTIVRRMKERGRRVFVWTVNSDDDVRLCEELGVDVIITDNPEQARRALG